MFSGVTLLESGNFVFRSDGDFLQLYDSVYYYHIPTSSWLEGSITAIFIASKSTTTTQLPTPIHAEPPPPVTSASDPVCDQVVVQLFDSFQSETELYIELYQQSIQLDADSYLLQSKRKVQQQQRRQHQQQQQQQEQQDQLVHHKRKRLELVICGCSDGCFAPVSESLTVSHTRIGKPTSTTAGEQERHQEEEQAEADDEEEEDCDSTGTGSGDDDEEDCDCEPGCACGGHDDESGWEDEIALDKDSFQSTSGSSSSYNSVVASPVASASASTSGSSTSVPVSVTRSVSASFSTPIEPSRPTSRSRANKKTRSC